MRIISVGGGKGGVGKSVVALNLAVELAQSGRKTVLVDLDLGAANLHTLLGLNTSPGGIGSFLYRTQSRRLAEFAVETGVRNLTFISGDGLIPGIAKIDPSAGKRLHALCSTFRPWLVLNMCRSNSDELAASLQAISRRFLGVDVGFLGAIGLDDAVRRSVLETKPVTVRYCLYLAGNCAGAAKVFAELAADATVAHDALFNLALAELQAGHYRESIRALDRLLASSPGDAEALGTRGWAHWLLEDDHRALADLTRAIGLKPANLSFRIARGYVSYRTRKYDLAVEDVETIVGLLPGNPGFLALLAEIKAKLSPP